ncbi:MAG: sigma-70 family RNA polymerase sigma factor [Bacteroidota bacterium]
MTEQDIIPHLFRTEFGKITAVLSRYLGIEHLEAAEDIASETFVTALENWPYHGMPAEPAAWLYTVAKNKAKNYISRRQLFKSKIINYITPASDFEAAPEIDLSQENIADSVLQMMFTICQPAIPGEAQISLALRILCGFGIDEIATALLTNNETIKKRLYRAKEKLRTENISLALPLQAEWSSRLQNVLTTLYLLFNEGYYSESNDVIVREELCREAIRLTYLLAENKSTSLPAVNALLSLMCFHASRLPARKNQNGDVLLYDEQDESLWNQELILKGVYFFKQAATGDLVTTYHLEAGIAYWHTIKNDTKEKWESILHLFNQLLRIQYSPVAALNRTYAFSKVHGKEAAIMEAKKLQLIQNHYYFTLLGELYVDIDARKAVNYYKQAIEIARTNTDKQTIQKKINEVDRRYRTKKAV